MRDLLLGLIGGFIGGWSSAVISRLRYRRRDRAVRAEFTRLLMAEYGYWRDAGDKDSADDTQSAISLGAMGAVSNVMAALNGAPAPWHRPAKPSPEKKS
jgi:hypothetical protein